MFRPYSQDQMMLLPASLIDFIEETHPVHLLNDLVEKLDLSVLEGRYGDLGQPAYHPRMMLKVILYGFSVGVFSARKLARACQENLAFQYLSGGERPAFKTFIEFRGRHEEDMREVFLETVKLAQALGLKKLGNVALDGTKIAADTSKHKAMSYGRMEKEEKRLREEIGALLKKAEETDAQEDREFGTDSDGYSLEEELAHRQERLKKIEEAKASLEAREKKDNPGQPIDFKKQISFADPQARCFSNKGIGTSYIYNAQAAVHMETQVIVENHIEDSTHDSGAVQTTLDNLHQGLGKVPEKLVADSAYANTDTLQACRDHQVIPICATREVSGKQSEARKKGETPASFSYDEKANTFRCPHGRLFEWDHDPPEGATSVYLAPPGSACTCRVGMSKKGMGVMPFR